MNGHQKRVLLAEDDQDQRKLAGSVLDNTEDNDLVRSTNLTHWRKTNVGNLMLWWCPINGLQLILLAAACLAEDADSSTVGW